MRPVLPAGCETNFGHCGSVGSSESVNLGGYGVELAFKNMEYKAMDDSTIKKGWISIRFWILKVEASFF